MNWRDHIVSDPDTLFGRPRIKGTRIGVDFLLGLLASGWSEEQILENYPHLKAEDLQVVFALVITYENTRLRRLPSNEP